MTAHSQRSTLHGQEIRFGASASDDLLSGLDAAHLGIETCIAELEIITSGAEPDNVLISSARMKIGQANLLRRKSVMDACAHLTRFLSPDEACAVRELQKAGLEGLQLTSDHIQ